MPSNCPFSDRGCIFCTVISTLKALNGMTLEQFYTKEEPVWEDEIFPLLANLDE
jgi:hypothetical protein